jgi:hypothetical protein
MKHSPSENSDVRELNEEYAREIIDNVFYKCKGAVISFDHVPEEGMKRLEAINQFVLLLSNAIVQHYNEYYDTAGFRNDVLLAELPSSRFGKFSKISFLQMTIHPPMCAGNIDYVPISFEIHGHVRCKGEQRFAHRFDLAVDTRKRIVDIRNNPPTPKFMKVMSNPPPIKKSDKPKKNNRPGNFKVAPGVPRTNEQFAELIRAYYDTTQNSSNRVIQIILDGPDIRSHFERHGNLSELLNIKHMGEKTIKLLEGFCSDGLVETIRIDKREKVARLLQSRGNLPGYMISSLIRNS